MLTYRTLTDAAYAALRYQVLLNVEETGDPKEIAYLDSKGIPTIGIGFNLKTNLNAVLSGFNFFSGNTALAAIEKAHSPGSAQSGVTHSPGSRTVRGQVSVRGQVLH